MLYCYVLYICCITLLNLYNLSCEHYGASIVMCLSQCDDEIVRTKCTIRHQKIGIHKISFINITTFLMTCLIKMTIMRVIVPIPVLCFKSNFERNYYLFAIIVDGINIKIIILHCSRIIA